VVWESDQPVYIFNVVAGRWQTARGQGVEVHHDPRHTVNVPEIVTALEAARRYYSQWFYPFPWQTLKLSEFAGLDVYAEGYPTNITFSENIGFLAKPGGDDHLVFWITAHEAAHQWWPNLVVPARGPGSEVLSEGMSHFSAMLLLEAVKGERARMEFARRIEHHYEKGRSASSEQPLTELDGDAERDGQSVVWYDRGGWAFWMLLQQMGRQEMFRGLRAFVENFRGNPDHPALPDLFAVLRPLARDGAAFDAFVQQWFERVTVPRFELLSARREKSGGGWRVTGRVVNTGTGRVPVDLAATTGQRFQPGYREARTRLHLEPDRPVDFTLETPFSPEQVVVDPDVMVLQLGRSAARRGL
jgi:ABC-2 type transport system permease protein